MKSITYRKTTRSRIIIHLVHCLRISARPVIVSGITTTTAVAAVALFPFEKEKNITFTSEPSITIASIVELSPHIILVIIHRKCPCVLYYHLNQINPIISKGIDLYCKNFTGLTKYLKLKSFVC